ncbi:thioesterase [Bradyrhizobium sp. AUGA SZCCT0274]|uniref:thioesterase II family protein n=1 Tax=Bradyrhizobium sp. AUGA SZCCT0274 TaxID=2807670 RepID=UPI001BA44DA9|nr:alpha/beta fold hydrolase [Bradyrhizobium sp. AUGA SZCCT0274]MBR1240316.1 thioesterase [Bradyrhizobium sp. AUGA SZCCT0274]
MTEHNTSEDTVMTGRDGDLRRWFPHRRPGPPAHLRLLCFPPAGAGAAVYRDWARLLPSGVDVCAFELSGHQTRFNEPLAHAVDDVVAEFIAASAALRDRPYVLLGHSLGAMIATEAARALCASGCGPTALVAVGCPAPSADIRNRAIADLDRQPFLEALVCLGGIEDEVLRNVELLDVLLPALRADCKMAEDWQAQAAARFLDPLPCAIGAISGNADSFVTAAELDAWRRHGSKAIIIRRVEGHHFFLRSRPEPVAALVGELSAS